MKKVMFQSPDAVKNRRELIAMITPEGDLIVDGCDTGPLVKQRFGDFDHEYSLSVKAKELPLLFDTLKKGGEVFSPETLVAHLGLQFGHENGFEALKTWLNQHQIPFSRWFS